MKVVHINTWDTGGAANAAKRLFRAQMKRGMDVSFLSLICSASQDDDLNDYESYMRNKYGTIIANSIRFFNKFYNQIPTKFDSSIFFNRPESLYRLHNCPLIKNADIIHLHSIVRFIDFPTFFKHVKKPIIWTLHDMNPFSGGKHYDSMMIKNLSSLERKFIQTKKTALQKSNIHVVSPSKWLMNLSESSEVLSGFPHYHIPYCISENKFYQIPRKSDSTEKKILFIAENIKDRRKGFRYLSEALKYLDKNIRITVVGNIHSKDIFRNHSNIEYSGYISSSDKLSEIYSEADVYVITSIEDNLPNTIIESHMCGTPVVGFNTSGISNMITDGFNGVLVDSINGKSLAEGINRAFDMIKNKQITSQKIIDKSKSHYSEKKVVNSYNAIYQNSLQEHDNSQIK